MLLAPISAHPHRHNVAIIGSEPQQQPIASTVIRHEHQVRVSALGGGGDTVMAGPGLAIV